MKSILVTGASGQLGSCLQDRINQFPDYHFYFTDVDTLDICDSKAVREYLQEYPVECIINCAAYTAVDKAETEMELSRRINRNAVVNLGEAAKATGATMIHISTDYVFDGNSFLPYKETDPTCPVSAYGKTKLEGEEALQKVLENPVIIRTSWLYSEYGNNFLKTMLRLGQERNELSVVFDQVGTPTYAGDLADAILKIVCQQIKEGWKPGIYHYSDEGVCSWYDFATAIFKISGITCKTLPIESVAYPTPAARPHYSVLNKSKIKSVYHLSIPHWEESLNQCYNKLMNQE